MYRPEHRNRSGTKEYARGATLVELMVMVAILGIFMAIVLPAYQNYAVRSKISEGLGFASAAKTAVVYSYSNGTMPESNAAAGLSEPEQISSQYVDRVSVEEGGDIRVTFNDRIPQLDNLSLVLAATPRGGAIDWCCYSLDIPMQYLPASCKNAAPCGSPPLAGGPGGGGGGDGGDDGNGDGGDDGNGDGGDDGNGDGGDDGNGDGGDDGNGDGGDDGNGDGGDDGNGDGGDDGKRRCCFRLLWWCLRWCQ
jgi:Tfp pilus assembly protein PilE